MENALKQHTHKSYNDTILIAIDVTDVNSVFVHRAECNEIEIFLLSLDKWQQFMNARVWIKRTLSSISVD